MPETIPKIYQDLSGQEQLEADYNLVGFFGLLMKIDRRIKAEAKSNESNRNTNNTDQTQ
jgi:hypothetical protein